MGFDAAKRVDPLDYDFTTLTPVPKGLEECKGTIPEPTVEQLQAFVDGYYSLLEMLDAVDPNSTSRVPHDPPAEKADDSESDEKPAPPKHRYDSMAAAVDAWEERTNLHAEDRARVEKALSELILGVAGDVITEDQIKAMPSRIRAAFLGWLVFELGPGKGLTSAMNESLAATASE